MWLKEFNKYDAFEWQIKIDFDRKTLIDDVSHLNKAFLEIYEFEDKNLSSPIEKWNNVFETMDLNSTSSPTFESLFQSFCRCLRLTRCQKELFSNETFLRERKANMILRLTGENIFVTEFKQEFRKKTDAASFEEIRSNSEV
ncbi:hypothetical protein TYRP_017000 [Tyrophagus putrescentiae]|nr:hypothetical protein TYRP_017000 [Tyrophagus putrescentiae]